MVCSCVVLASHAWEASVVPPKRVLLQIIFCSCVIGTGHAFERKMADCFPELPASKWLKWENKLGDRIIKQFLNSVIAKFGDLSASRKSRYFDQPRRIIVNYCWTANNYRVHHCRTNLKKITILYQGPKIWNFLPVQITSLSSFPSFKTKLLESLVK